MCRPDNLEFLTQRAQAEEERNGPVRELSKDIDHTNAVSKATGGAESGLPSSTHPNHAHNYARAPLA